MKTKVLIISLTLAALAVVLFTRKKMITDVLAAWKLAPAPETFTELYFNRHLSLPLVITPGGRYNFSFTIRNQENTDMEYPFIVYRKSAEGVSFIDRGIIYLPKNTSDSVSETFGPLNPVRGQIVVDLTGINQQIDFWMEVK